MPEIAEVRVYKDSVHRLLQDKHLTRVSVIDGRYNTYQIQDEQGNWIGKLKNPKTGKMINIKPQEHPGGRRFVDLPGLDELNQYLPEAPPATVHVKGKFCWIEVGLYYIGFTFGMAGGIYYEPSETTLKNYMARKGKSITKEQYMKHFHVKFEIEDGKCFYFGDTRHLGTVTISKDRSKLAKKLSELGHDQLSEAPMEDAQFIQIFRQPRFNYDNICKVLMGQKAISGVGNYIKAEVLYACGINPWAHVSDLDDTKLIELHQAIQKITHQAYNARGASLYTYVGSQSEQGAFQNMLKVYKKDKDPDGIPVKQISEDVSPDKRTAHYVLSKQMIGAHRDPVWIRSNTPKLAVKLKPKVTLEQATDSVLGYLQSITHLELDGKYVNWDALEHHLKPLIHDYLQTSDQTQKRNLATAIIDHVISNDMYKAEIETKKLLEWEYHGYISSSSPINNTDRSVPEMQNPLTPKQNFSFPKLEVKLKTPSLQPKIKVNLVSKSSNP